LDSKAKSHIYTRGDRLDR